MQQSQDFSLHGAVDLGARQAAAQRREQAAKASASGGQAGAPSASVIDVTDQTFNVDVVDRSRSVPVILDLWAEWCGPCKQLSPVLEKLAAEADGAWVLAKVDVDSNPQLSAALQVQSIPMVVAVVAGQVVDGFLGALPEANVREWIGQIMQVAEQLGMPGVGAADAGADGQDAGRADADQAAGPGQAGSGQGGPGQAGPGQAGSGQGGPGQAGPGQAGPGPGRAPGPRGPGGPGAGPDGFGDPGFAEAQQAMERGDMDGAAAAFEKVLATAPGHPAAAMGLAQIDLIRRVNSYDQAKVRRDAEDNPDDPDAQGRAADMEVAMGRIDAGFDRLLDTVRRTSGAERNQARVQLLRLFDAFPPRDPRVAKARATLSSLLF
jgi:putative thioredoxin